MITNGLLRTTQLSLCVLAGFRRNKETAAAAVATATSVAGRNFFSNQSTSQLGLSPDCVCVCMCDECSYWSTRMQPYCGLGDEKVAICLFPPQNSIIRLPLPLQLQLQLQLQLLLRLPFTLITILRWRKSRMISFRKLSFKLVASFVQHRLRSLIHTFGRGHN